MREAGAVHQECFYSRAELDEILQVEKVLRGQMDYRVDSLMIDSDQAECHKVFRTISMQLF